MISVYGNIYIYIFILIHNLIVHYYSFILNIQHREAYILYGSQTGNAESIAQDLYLQCKDIGIPCKCQTLDSVKKANLKELVSIVIVVVSTTGNGDSPENCEGFWRMIKSRKNVSY